MINEPLIHKHYTDMPLSELESRSLQLDAQRQHIGKGQMPHGMSVYRRRLMKALETKRAEQAAQQERYMHSEPRAFNTRLSAQQLYDRGMQQGRRDAISEKRSSGNCIEDTEERRGYHDGYRSVRRW
ncbi:MAG: hypothetical protein Q7S29_04890 [Candidatus Peribacter sp.]|nr:hypothetical protein [Candidatus Peribacter sp.]